MVTAKYLCSAPHPDTWDERAEALLKSLGGDKAKRRKILRETLAVLDTEKLVRKIPRPGRKTNAEHAIAFYRYVLSLNEGDVAVEESEEDASKSAEESVKKPRTPLEPKVFKSRMQQRVSKRKRGSGDEKAETASIMSMDSEEFRDQHNDLCEVCNDAGELICCSTCNLVFHLQCIRPPTTRFPPDRWCCAYCVAAGVRGHTKEARTRRRAAAAAREMTRMKNELQGDEASESKDKSDERRPAANRRGRPRRGAKSEEEDAAEDAEPEAKRVRLDGERTGAEEVKETAEGRARRDRRQPHLYDPQAGAASTWQSDGVIEWKSLGDGHDTEDETASKETNEETDDSKASNERVWCNFCNDDPSISVCCFCACRECFGKHDKANLLICDNCDAEYHIYCLDPPLKSVPPAKKWFCATCNSASNNEKKTPPTPEPREEQKRRGRPPKKLSQDVDSTSVPQKKRGRPPKKPSQAVPVPQKKRGRPPKNNKAPSVNPAPPNTPVRSNVTMKRRGRPPKNVRPAQAAGGIGNERATGSMLSVPASVSVPTDSSSLGMPLVTPHVNPGVSTTQPDMSQGSLEETVLQKSRSGRTVKRNPFHDEIYEGRQLMKTASRPTPAQYQQHAAVQPTISSGSQSIGQAPSYQAYLQQQQQKQQQQAKNAPTSTVLLPQQGKPPAKMIDSAPVTQGINMSSVPSMVRPAPATAAAAMPTTAVMPQSARPITVATTQGSLPVPPAVLAYPSSVAQIPPPVSAASASKMPRRKPGARECMQMSRRFGVKVIPQNYMDTLLDYCSRGKVEHLIKMRERLDDHSRMLEAQLAGLEALVKEKGELDITVPAAESVDTSPPLPF